MKTFVKAVCYVLLILLVAVIIGFIFKFTNGFNEDMKTFYIEYSGKYSKHIQILTTENEMTFEKGTPHRFDVKYVFDKDGEEPKGYKVKIVPNMTRDFDYTVDGERYLFSKLGDLTDIFAPVKYDSYFELNIGEDLSFEGVLMKAQGGNSISVSQDAFKSNPYPFKLQISSYNGKVTYNINFTFSSNYVPDDDVREDQSLPIKPPEKPLYNIVRDSLGWGSLDCVDLVCQDKAAAGEVVTFSATVKQEYINEFCISGITVQLCGTDSAYKEKLPSSNGTYTFVMPDAETMEREESVCLLLYIIPIDM